ncbi:unnamed protein product [Amoebophrya sp. A120]|nr:unnamed protein product [Amoebophrya sp. A120]|eukprot:GSA120T00012878001.1
MRSRATVRLFYSILSLAAAGASSGENHDPVEDAKQACPPGISGLVPEQEIARLFGREELANAWAAATFGENGDVSFVADNERNALPPSTAEDEKPAFGDSGLRAALSVDEDEKETKAAPELVCDSIFEQHTVTGAAGGNIYNLEQAAPLSYAGRLLREIAHYYECGDAFSPNLHQVLDEVALLGDAMAELQQKNLMETAAPSAGGNDPAQRAVVLSSLDDDEDPEEREDPKDGVVGTSRGLSSVVAHQDHSSTSSTIITDDLRTRRHKIIRRCVSTSEKEPRIESGNERHLDAVLRYLRRLSFATLLGLAVERALLRFENERAQRLAGARTLFVEEDTSVTGELNYEDVRASSGVGRENVASIVQHRIADRISATLSRAHEVESNRNDDQSKPLSTQQKLHEELLKNLNLLHSIAHIQQTRSGSQKILFIDAEGFKRTSFRSSMENISTRTFDRLAQGLVVPKFLIDGFVDALRERTLHNDPTKTEEEVEKHLKFLPAREISQYLQSSLIQRPDFDEHRRAANRHGLIEHFAKLFTQRLDLRNATLAFAFQDLSTWKFGAPLHPAPNMRENFAARRHAYDFLTGFGNGLAKQLVFEGEQENGEQDTITNRIKISTVKVNKKTTNPDSTTRNVVETLVLGFQAIRAFGIYPEIVLRGYQAITGSLIAARRTDLRERTDSTKVRKRPWADYVSALLGHLVGLLKQQKGLSPVYYEQGKAVLVDRQLCLNHEARHLSKLIQAECELRRLGAAHRRQPSDNNMSADGASASRSISSAKDEGTDSELLPLFSDLSQRATQWNDLFDLWSLEPTSLVTNLQQHSRQHFTHYARVQYLIAAETPALSFPMLLVNSVASSVSSNVAKEEPPGAASATPGPSFQISVAYNPTPQTELQDMKSNDEVEATDDHVAAAPHWRGTSQVVQEAQNADLAEDFKDFVLVKILEILRRSAGEDECYERAASSRNTNTSKTNTNPCFYVEIGVGASAIEHNTRFLRTFQGWHGVLLDSHYGLPRVNLHQEIVTEENVLEILAKHDVPENFELLSLDIDGQDYHVVRKILLSQLGKNTNKRSFRPRVIVVEHVHGYAWPNVVVPLDHWLVPKSRRSFGSDSEQKRVDENKDEDGITRNKDEHAASQQDNNENHNDEDKSDHSHLMFASSARALLELLQAFDYDLVYYGDFDLVFVAKADLNHVEKHVRHELASTLPFLPAGSGTSAALLANLDRAALTFRSVNDLHTLCLRYKTSLRVVLRDIRIIDNESYCLLSGEADGDPRPEDADGAVRGSKIVGYSRKTLETRFHTASAAQSSLFTREQLRSADFLL